MIVHMKTTHHCLGRKVTVLLAFLLVLGVSSAFGGTSSSIVVLPFKVYPGPEEKKLRDFSLHVHKRLRSSLEAMEDSCSLVDREIVEKLLGDGPPPGDHEEAVELTCGTGARFVIFGSLQSGEDGCRMKGIMWDLKKNRMTVTVDLKTENIHGLPEVLRMFLRNINIRLQGTPKLPLYKSGLPGIPDKAPDEQRIRPVTTAPRSDEPWRSPVLPVRLRSVDIGDLDGDKQNETVLTDEHEVTIRRFEDGNLKTLTQFSKPPAVFLGGQTADIDGDGVCELLLCMSVNDRIESAIVRYTDRRFKITARFPDTILRTIPDDTNKVASIIVGQKTDETNMFSGRMIRYEYNEGKLKPVGNVDLPPGTLLLSYASGYLDKEKPPFRIILNQDRRLMVFDTENRLVANVMDRLYGLNDTIDIRTGEGMRQITVPGRLTVADTDADGRNELLVIKRNPTGSIIEGLIWEDDALHSKWKSVQTGGTISDFSIEDFKNHGARSLVVILQKRAPLLTLASSSFFSIVYAYDMIQ
jgi:hypothetical protein